MTNDAEDPYEFTLTVADLKAVIAHAEREGLPEDAVVVMSKDGEGNWYAPLAGYAAEYVFVPQHSGGGGSESLKSWDDYDDDDDVEDLTQAEWRERTLARHPHARRCLLLWPV